MLGDFNARIVRKIDEHIEVGRYGEEVINSNEEVLINFCSQSPMIIQNGYFKYKDIRK